MEPAPRLVPLHLAFCLPGTSSHGSLHAFPSCFLSEVPLNDLNTLMGVHCVAPSSLRLWLPEPSSQRKWCLNWDLQDE